ncbi:valine--tRNA ligase [Phtheirospermum japonicum]|uniref:Valine--tRNA ligase n=1 Tax=Phtheirospermum japonicum TaxID=374723 RepID=A0A830CQU5_9LAMI|nr:valine--tRNA ligase [Phtheirospermum japonicum]
MLDPWIALWPFSTLGWPDVSAEDFKKFYPTSVLETNTGIVVLQGGDESNMSLLTLEEEKIAVLAGSIDYIRLQDKIPAMKVTVS